MGGAQTFFELQTAGSDEMAAVEIIVSKVFVSSVLMRVVYHRSSLYVAPTRLKKSSAWCSSFWTSCFVVTHY